MNDTGPRSEDPWEEARQRWESLSEKLRQHYRQLDDQEAPSEEEVQSALRTLGGAARALAGSLEEAIRDPEVRERVKEAASSFASAVGRSVGEVAEDLRRPPSSSEDDRDR